MLLLSWYLGSRWFFFFLSTPELAYLFTYLFIACTFDEAASSSMKRPRVYARRCATTFVYVALLFTFAFILRERNPLCGSSLKNSRIYSHVFIAPWAVSRVLLSGDQL